MYRSLHIQNFRVFGDFEMESLARVNLIGGGNNVGKTALLEAIAFVTRPDKVECLASANHWRTTENQGSRGTPSLFRDYDPTRGIQLATIEVNGTQRSLMMVLDGETRTRYILDASDVEPASVYLKDDTIWNIVVTAESDTDSATTRIAANPARGVFAESLHAKWKMPRLTFIPAVRHLEYENVERYVQMELQGRSSEIVEAVRIVIPKLKRLVTLPTGSKTELYVDVEGSPLTPISLLGEGTRRLLSFILAVVASKGGIVLIDEIENGIHYSHLGEVWTRIAEVARRYDVQVFATTHSWECIVAAYEAFKGSEPYDFCYHRLARSNDDVVCASLGKDRLDAVMPSDLEIR